VARLLNGQANVPGGKRSGAAATQLCHLRRCLVPALPGALPDDVLLRLPRWPGSLAQQPLGQPPRQGQQLPPVGAFVLPGSLHLAPGP
jgi:hypothetical protein